MRARRLLGSEYFVLYACVAYAAIMAPFTPNFLSADNAANVFSSLLPLVIVAVGETVVLVTGGIDLSVTSIIAFASISGALVMTSPPRSALLGAAAMVAIGAAIGSANGAAIATAKMPPFMATLTTMMFFGGLAVWMTKSKNVGGLPRPFIDFGDSPVATAAVAFCCIAAAHFVLARTVMGRGLYAIGRNARTALVSGVPVRSTTIAAYIFSGVLAAIAAVIYTGRLETGSPVLGQRILLDVIAAVVIGGTSLFGGRGKALWTAFGALFITLVDNTLNLLGVSNFAVLMAKGAVILAAALLDSLRSRYA